MVQLVCQKLGAMVAIVIFVVRRWHASCYMYFHEISSPRNWAWNKMTQIIVFCHLTEKRNKMLFPEKAPSLAAILARCCTEKYQKMGWIITIITRLQLYPPTIRIEKKIREKGEGHTQEKGSVQYRRHDFKHGVLHYSCPSLLDTSKAFKSHFSWGKF